MDSHLSFIEGLVTRLEGPMSFRFLMQPLVALILAFRDGRKDALEGRPPYFWALFTGGEYVRHMLQSSWKSIGKVFVIAIVLDFVFQYIVFHDFRLFGALLAGLILAVLPYILLRGPANRLIRLARKGKALHNETCERPDRAANITSDSASVSNPASVSKGET